MFPANIIGQPNKSIKRFGQSNTTINKSRPIKKLILIKLANLTKITLFLIKIELKHHNVQFCPSSLVTLNLLLLGWLENITSLDLVLCTCTCMRKNASTIYDKIKNITFGCHVILAARVVTLTAFVVGRKGSLHTQI